MEANPVPNAAQPKSRRRRYQYSLPARLIVVGLARVACAVGMRLFAAAITVHCVRLESLTYATGS